MSSRGSGGREFVLCVRRRLVNSRLLGHGTDFFEDAVNSRSGCLRDRLVRLLSQSSRFDSQNRRSGAERSARKRDLEPVSSGPLHAQDALGWVASVATSSNNLLFVAGEPSPVTTQGCLSSKRK